MAERRLSAAFGLAQSFWDREAAPRWCCPACFARPSNSPAVVGECLVGFGHAVGFFALLDGATTVSEASISSAASFFGMVFSPRLRAESISQRMARAILREARTSTGTW